jgi:hypothetical protein
LLERGAFANASVDHDSFSQRGSTNAERKRHANNEVRDAREHTERSSKN